MKSMLRLLWLVIRRLKFDRILLVFVLCFFASSLILLAVEPGISRLGDACWYMFVACTSIGFGDILAMTVAGRILTVVMTLFEIFMVALFSGVVISYYLEVVRRRENETLAVFLDKMEHLTELPPEELEEIQEKVKKLR